MVEARRIPLQEEPKLKVLEGGKKTYEEKQQRIMEIISLQAKKWEDMEPGEVKQAKKNLAKKLTEAVIKNNDQIRELRGKDFISAEVRQKLKREGVEIPTEAEFDEMVANKGMEEATGVSQKEIVDKKGREFLAQNKKERERNKQKANLSNEFNSTEKKFFNTNEEKETEMTSEELENIDNSVELYKKLGKEEKTIIDLFANEKDPIKGSERAIEYINNTEYLSEVKPENLENFMNYLKNDHDIYKNLIIEINSLLPEESENKLAEEKFFDQKQAPPATNYDQESSLNNFEADLEYKATKALKKEDRKNLESLIDIRKADDKKMFKEYLNKLTEKQQEKILPILELREDTEPWVEEWKPESTHEKEKEPGFWGRIKNKINMKFGSK